MNAAGSPPEHTDCAEPMVPPANEDPMVIVTEAVFTQPFAFVPVTV